MVHSKRYLIVSGCLFQITRDTWFPSLVSEKAPVCKNKYFIPWKCFDDNIQWVQLKLSFQQHSQVAHCFQFLTLLGCVRPTVQRLFLVFSVKSYVLKHCVDILSTMKNPETLSRTSGVWGRARGGQPRQISVARSWGSVLWLWANVDGVSQSSLFPFQMTMPSCVTSPLQETGGRTDGMPWSTSVNSMLQKLTPTSFRTVSKMPQLLWN